MVTISLPLDEELVKSLEATAKKSGVTMEDFVARTLHAAIDEERYLVAVHRGLADVKAGRVVEGDAMERWLSSWGDDDEVEPPPCRS